MELHEVGVDAQGSTEPEGSNDVKIFFKKYPHPFLKYYETFPLAKPSPWDSNEQETATTGTSLLFPRHLLVWTQTWLGKAVWEILSPSSLSEVNLDPDSLVDMVSIMVNKFTCEPFVKDIMDKYYEMFRGKNPGEGWRTKRNNSTSKGSKVRSHWEVVLEDFFLFIING
jgi:hypothetical protein